jgi:DNA-binding transcriptional LysR family regulator
MSQNAQSSRAAMSELHGVVAVATHRNFRRAALELGVSPSALSHAVASLEEQLGVKLFHRTTRSVSLTEVGERFLERVQPALQQLSDALDTVNDFREKPRGTLRINAAATAAARIFDALIVPFLQRYPEMKLEIVAEGRLVDIVAGGFDAGIRLAEAVPRDMVSVPCGPPMRFVVVASPAYLKGKPRPRSPADLLAHECIRRRMPSGAPLPWELEKNGQTLELDVQGALTLDSEELAVLGALRGLGITWCNAWAVERHVAEGRLVTLLDDWAQEFPGICLYYPPHRHQSAGLRAFVEMAREADLSGAKKRRRPRS